VTCQDAQDLFSALVDEVIEPGLRRELQTHLSGCPGCRRELEAFQKTLRALGALLPLRAPAGFADRVLRAAGHEPWHRRLLRRLFVPVRVKVPLEAVALLLVAVGAVYVAQRSPELRRAARQEAPSTPASPEDKVGLSERQKTVERPLPPAVESARQRAASGGKEDDDKGAGQLRKQARLEGAAPQKPPPGEAALPGKAETTETARSDVALPGPAPTGRDEERMRAPAQGSVSRDRREAAAPPAVREPALRALESAGREAEVGSRAAVAAKARPAADVAGRLRVENRPRAETLLAELVRRLGGEEAAGGRRAGEDKLEIVVSGGRYGDLVEGLARIGTWTVEREPAPVPAQVRVSIRIVE
jgi:hypothetical protein